MRIVRFGRARTCGVRYAIAHDTRRSCSSIEVGTGITPSCHAPFWSGTIGRPRFSSTLATVPTKPVQSAIG